MKAKFTSGFNQNENTKKDSLSCTKILRFELTIEEQLHENYPLILDWLSECRNIIVKNKIKGKIHYKLDEMNKMNKNKR